MIRSLPAKRIRVALTGWLLATGGITSKYPSIFTRNIAVLTDDLRDEWKKNGGLKSMESLPGPKIYPFVGNLGYLKTDFHKMHNIQLEDAKKYGPIYKYHIFKIRAIIVQDPDICKEIYRAEGKMPMRDFSLSFREFMKERHKLHLPKSLLEL